MFSVELFVVALSIVVNTSAYVIVTVVIAMSRHAMCDQAYILWSCVWVCVSRGEWLSKRSLPGTSRSPVWVWSKERES